MYFNTLIIMNEDALGYGNRSRKPSGYCKLTMPNRVSCYVQGLRQLPKGQIYKLYLTSKSKQQSVEVGMLQVGVNGNKETRWVMNPSSINNSEVSAEEVDGAFIMVSGDDIKGDVVPLVGFSSEPYTWKHLVTNTRQTSPEHITKAKQIITPEAVEASQANSKTESSKEAEASPKTEASKKVEISPKTEAHSMREDLEAMVLDEESIQDNLASDEILELKEEVKQLNRTLKESKAIIEALQRQASKIDEVPETQQASPESSTTKSPQSEPLEKVSGINEYINNFIRKFQAEDRQEQRADYQEIGDIFQKRIPINPFEAQNTGIKWVRITHEDLRSFPSLDPEWTNQALIMDAHRDYKHFILGRDESGLTYYLGIPGVFDLNRESPLNIDKIERFTCCHNVPPKVGEAGYWIAMV